MIQPCRARQLIPVLILVLAYWPGSGTPTGRWVWAAETEKTRILHFPPDRSMGALHIQNGPVAPSLGYPYRHSDDGWVYFGEAMGDVAVPAGRKIRLNTNTAAAKDLSPLSRLGPNDLYMLIVTSFTPSDAPAGKNVMTHLGGLTGLEILMLFDAHVPNEALRHVAGLKSLKELGLSGNNQFGDEGLAYLADSKSLEILDLESTEVTDAGLLQLAKLASLRELRVDGPKIRGPGLAHLAKLPSLNRLVLRGSSPYNKRATDNTFSNEALTYLENIKSLKDLDLGWLPVTDDGLSHLSGLTSLEVLSIFQSKITDAGLVHLKSMPSLKKLQLGGTRVTDAGLAHLKEIKSLKSLDLPGDNMTADGLASLAHLPRLKSISFSFGGPKVPGKYSPAGDAGLRHLTQLQSLEKLHMDGRGVTDQGMSYIASLTSLKELSLTNLLSVSDEGLAKLTAIKSLNTLWLYSAPKITVSGLKCLNALPGLIELNVNGIGHDGPRLDISGLTQLRWLWLSPAKPLGDEDLACLAKMTHLEWLQIEAGNCSDKGLAYLAGLTSLEILYLGNAHLTGEGLKSLANMKRLNTLYVAGNFTDDDLHRLEGLTALQRLTITPEKDFSPAALSDFKKKMPGLDVLQAEKAKPQKSRPRR